MIYGDLFLTILEILCALLLYRLADYAAKAISNKWRVCYMLPAAICLIATAFCGFEAGILGVYIGSCLLLSGFFKDDRIVRKCASILAAVCMLVSVPVCVLYDGYRQTDYAADFETGFAAMKAHYILTEHKGIDWDALHEKYLPKFEAVNAAHDEVENYIVWNQFCKEFYDGHVSFSPSGGEQIVELAGERQYGNDYGLALMTIEDGRTVAVNVEPDSAVSEAGIKNGTVITAWDGKSIDELAEQTDALFMSFPDKDNAMFYHALPVAGIGGGSVTISYLDDSGVKKQVTVQKIGAYSRRLTDTLHILDQGIEGSNLSWLTLNDTTSCLRIKTMMYDNESYANGDHSEMQAELRDKLLALKSGGVTNLVIDVRSNDGGSPQFIMAVAALLAPEGEHTYCSEGVWDEKSGNYVVDSATGKYVTGKSFSYQGENLWGDGNIVILVNAECVSAGEHFIKLMSDFDNVTVMGFTKSNGSAQAVRYVNLESGILTFSAIPALDADGNIFIDSGISHEIGIELDVKVPFDETAVKALFDDGEDYLLQQASALSASFK